MNNILKKDVTTFALPARENVVIHGLVTTPSQHFNPRCFTINAGQGAGHWLALYRSPLGTVIPSAGALIGTLYYEPEEGQQPYPASWAILTIVVTPTVGNPMTFTAQADSHGDFILPLNRIPALHKDAPSSSYPAVLTIRAAENASTLPSHQHSHNTPMIIDPDDLVTAHMGNIEDNENFLSSVALHVIPGQTRRLLSYNKIILRYEYRKFFDLPFADLLMAIARFYMNTPLRPH